MDETEPAPSVQTGPRVGRATEGGHSWYRRVADAERLGVGPEIESHEGALDPHLRLEAVLQLGEEALSGGADPGRDGAHGSTRRVLASGLYGGSGRYPAPSRSGEGAHGLLFW